PLRPAHLGAGLVGALALLGLFSLASAPAGGMTGGLVARLIGGTVGPLGTALVLGLVLLVGLVIAFRFSVGTLLLGVVATARAAYEERERLEKLVRGPRAEAKPAQAAAAAAAVPAPSVVAALPAPTPAPGPTWLPEEQEERALAA